MTVLPVSEAQWQALKAVRLDALRDAPAAFGVTYAQSSANTEEAWRDHAAGRRGVAFFLAWQGGEAVGIAGGVTGMKGMTDDAGGGACELVAMWVRPACRGSGVAAQLVDAVKAHALAAGLRRVELDVAPDNLPAARFYQKQGFVFQPHWEPLASHPHIQVQRMAWQAPA